MMPDVFGENRFFDIRYNKAQRMANKLFIQDYKIHNGTVIILIC